MLLQRMGHRFRPLPHRPTLHHPTASKQATMDGLLILSDKEFWTIFDCLSTTPRVIDPAALPLALTCHRLLDLYRLNYVTCYNCNRLPKRPVQTLPPSPELLPYRLRCLPHPHIHPVARIFLRLPHLTSLALDFADWTVLHRFSRPIPQTITSLTLCENTSSPDPERIYSPLHLPILRPALPRLHTLHLLARDINLSSHALPDIASLTCLRDLALRTCDASGGQVAAMLAQMPRLAALALTNVNFAAAVVDALPPGLDRLCLHDTSTAFDGTLGNDEVRAICALPKLRHLDICGSSRLTDWTSLLPAAHRLESLALRRCSLHLSYDRSCRSTLALMLNLLSLKLEDTSDEYDEVLFAAATLPKLKTLSLAAEEMAEEVDMDCAVSRPSIVALSEGVARRSLTSLSLNFFAFDTVRLQLQELCSTLFAPKLGQPTVNLSVNFD